MVSCRGPGYHHSLLHGHQQRPASGKTINYFHLTGYHSNTPQDFYGNLLLVYRQSKIACEKNGLLCGCRLTTLTWPSIRSLEIFATRRKRINYLKVKREMQTNFLTLPLVLGFHTRSEEAKVHLSLNRWQINYKAEAIVS